MNIGMTYDLRDDYRRLGYGDEDTAEFDNIQTVEAIEAALRALGHQPERIGHVGSLAARLVAGARWDLVFNIAEGMSGVSREAQVPALLEAYQIPYTFSDPMVLGLALHKAMAKRVVRDLGIATPEFEVVEADGDIEKIGLPFPLFAKPVAEGASKGVTAASQCHTSEELRSACRGLLQQFRQPVLIERFLAGRELTVGMVGTGRQARALGVMEILLHHGAEPDVYSYTNKVYYEGRVGYRLVDGDLAAAAIEVAGAAWTGLGCRDGGRVDLRCDLDGRVYFLEVNPLAGVDPARSDLVILCNLVGVSYGRLIQLIVESASERVPLVRPLPAPSPTSRAAPIA